MLEAFSATADSLNAFFTSAAFKSFLTATQAIFISASIIFVVLIVTLLFKLKFFDKKIKRKLNWYFPKEKKTVYNKWYRAWEKIKKSLDKAEKDEYQIVLFRAKDFLDMSLDELGFWGETLESRLERMGPDRISNLSEVIRAHSFVNAIKKGESLTISYEEAKQVLDIFEKVLSELGIV